MAVALFQVLLFVGGMIIPQYRIFSSYINKKEAKVKDVVSRSVDKAATAPAPDIESEELQELILMRNSTLLYSIVFVSATSLIFGFYFSHRLGGPVFKTIQYLRNYREGQKVGPLSFRNGDFFHELADEMNLVLKQQNKSVPD